MEERLYHEKRNEYEFERHSNFLRRAYKDSIHNVRMREQLRLDGVRAKYKKAKNRFERERLIAEYRLIKKTHHYNDLIDLENIEHDYLNRYNSLCIKYDKLDPFSPPAVKLSLIAHKKADKVFRELEHNTATHLALFRSRLHEIDKNPSFISNHYTKEEYNEGSSAAYKTSLTFATLIVLVALVITIGLFGFADAIKAPIKGILGLSILHILVLVGLLFALFAISFYLLGRKLNNDYHNPQLPNVDFYRLQLDKNDKIKKNLAFLDQKMHELASEASKYQKQSYYLAYNAYHDAVAELRSQLTHTQDSYKMIHNEINKFHAEKTREEKAMHDLAIKNMNRLYVEDHESLKAHYEDEISRLHIIHDNHIGSILKQAKKEALDFTDLKSKQLLAEQYAKIRHDVIIKQKIIDNVTGEKNIAKYLPKRAAVAPKKPLDETGIISEYDERINRLESAHRNEIENLEKRYNESLMNINANVQSGDQTHIVNDSQQAQAIASLLNEKYETVESPTITPTIIDDLDHVGNVENRNISSVSDEVVLSDSEERREVVDSTPIVDEKVVINDDDDDVSSSDAFVSSVDESINEHIEQKHHEVKKHSKKHHDEHKPHDVVTTSTNDNSEHKKNKKNGKLRLIINTREITKPASDLSRMFDENTISEEKQSLVTKKIMAFNEEE
jgi:hypothetical protein